MSSEKFNIEDIKTESKEKEQVKFVVDELGLNQALPKIPTDVEYFINKQRGLGESTSSFGQLYKEATDIENTGIVLYNKFSDSLSKNFKEDPTYQVNKEQFDEIETYPDYMQNAFLEARSEEHFYHIKKQVDERLDVERELNNAGWKGFSARVLAAGSDLLAWGLSYATGGLLAPLMYGGKIAR